MNGIMQCVSSVTSFFYLSESFPSSSGLLSLSDCAFFFMTQHYTECLYPILFIHYLTDICGFPHLLATVANAAVNILVQFLYDTHLQFSLVYT